MAALLGVNSVANYDQMAPMQLNLKIMPLGKTNVFQIASYVCQYEG